MVNQSNGQNIFENARLWIYSSDKKDMTDNFGQEVEWSGNKCFPLQNKNKKTLVFRIWQFKNNV